MIVRLKGGKDLRGKDGDVVPDVDAIKAPHLDNSEQMASPSAHSPMTPWIASQVAAPPTGAGSSGNMSFSTLTAVLSSSTKSGGAVVAADSNIAPC